VKACHEFGFGFRQIEWRAVRFGNSSDEVDEKRD